MTARQEEKRKVLEERNVNICAHYHAYSSITQTAKEFGLKPQRVLQILKERGVWRPYSKGKSQRTEFVGINVDKPTKTALVKEAEVQGVSVSKLSADALANLVKYRGNSQ